MSREDNISDSWEQYADESELEKRLERERREMSAANGLTVNGNDDFKPRILQREPKAVQTTTTNQIKILKRPESTSSSATNPQNNTKPQIKKTLEQREKEYAEARKRILGSSEPTFEEMNKQVVYSRVSPSSSSSSLQNYSSSQQLTSQQQLPPQKVPENIIRQPKGPSNSNPGFRIRR